MSKRLPIFCGCALAVLAGLCLPRDGRCAGTSEYKRVVIYYDDFPGQPYNYGRKYVNALRNLLGHFRTLCRVQDVATYAEGGLDDQAVSFYIGGYFRGPDSQLPAVFLRDVARSTNTVVWVNYNIWDLLWSTNDCTRFGLKYDGFSDGVPNGYDRVSYKDTELFKGTYDFSLAFVTPTNAFARVLATAYSSTDPGLTERPYVLRASNFWYVADNCLEDDVDISRTLVLCDLLHDILRTGVPTQHRAIVRIEDLNAGYTELDNLELISAMLAGRGIKPSYGVIARFVDPSGEEPELDPDIPISNNRAFLRTLQTVMRRGGYVLSHGYTHSNTEENEISGEGFEFWYHGTNAWTDPPRPLAGDGFGYAYDRIDRARDEILKCGLRAHIWETPHYEASLLAYCAFATRYRVWYERLRAFNVFTEGLTTNQVEILSNSNPAYKTQYAPYVIYHSVYGTTVIPENLNYFDPTFPDGYGRLMTVSNKMIYARQLRVVRDAVASFYFHTYRDATNLVAIVNGLEDLGYTFTDVETLLGEQPAE